MRQTLHIAVAGTIVTTGASSVATAIPVAADGVKPKRVRLSVVNAAAAYAHVRAGLSGSTVTTADTPIMAADSQILNVQGHTHICHIQGSAAAVLVITPLED